MSKLTHFDAKGQAHMVNVGHKSVTHRRAEVEGYIRMQESTLQHIIAGNHRKGDVLGTARVAAIMGTKRTSDLVPLCHPIAISSVNISLEPQIDKSAVYCRAEVTTDAKTGVEIEAFMAVQVALLTIYDMCKAVDRGMCITDIRLLSKSGGQSGTWTAITED